MTVLGCDIARYGEDSSVISICQDSEILPLKNSINFLQWLLRDSL
jgi:hypothetical protein